MGDGYKIIRIEDDVNTHIREEQARLIKDLERHISVNNAIRSLLGMKLKFETKKRKSKEDN